MVSVARKRYASIPSSDCGYLQSAEFQLRWRAKLELTSKRFRSTLGESVQDQLKQCAKEWALDPRTKLWIPTQLCRQIHICPVCIKKRASDHAKHYCEQIIAETLEMRKYFPDWEPHEIRVVGALCIYPLAQSTADLDKQIRDASGYNREALTVLRGKRPVWRHRPSVRQLPNYVGPWSMGVHFVSHPSTGLSTHRHILFAVQNNGPLKAREHFDLFKEHWLSFHGYDKGFDPMIPSQVMPDFKTEKRRASASLLTNLDELRKSPEFNHVGRKAAYNFDFCSAKNYVSAFEKDPEEATKRFAEHLATIYGYRSYHRLCPFVAKPQLKNAPLKKPSACPASTISRIEHIVRVLPDGTVAGN